jgi:hypothetical protein
MNLNVMYEDLARAQNRERLEQARAANQGYHLARTLRLARRPRRVVSQPSCDRPAPSDAGSHPVTRTYP